MTRTKKIYFFLVNLKICRYKDESYVCIDLVSYGLKAQDLYTNSFFYKQLGTHQGLSMVMKNKIEKGFVWVRQCCCLFLFKQLAYFAYFAYNSIESQSSVIMERPYGY